MRIAIGSGIGYSSNSYNKGGFKPIVFNVTDSPSSTALSAATSSGLCTWKFYSGGSLDAEYETNSVAHIWNTTGDRYFEFYPPSEDWSLITGTLNWSFKNLIGAIPPEIGNLSNLTQLYLYINQITSIPPEIGNLSGLSRLYLYGNQITSIPPEIGNLSTLNTLWLYANQITSIPPEIGNLSNLAELRLYANQLTSIPPEIGDLSNLQILYLNNNDIIQHNVTSYSTGDGVDFRYDTNLLSQSEVDDILVTINATGGNNLSVDVSGTGNAAPSATGVAAVNAIIARGGTVTTN